MGKTRPPYLREFRDEAVRLVREAGKSVYQVAKDLGVADQSLRNWVKQADLAPVHVETNQPETSSWDR